MAHRPAELMMTTNPLAETTTTKQRGSLPPAPAIPVDNAGSGQRQNRTARRLAAGAAVTLIAGLAVTVWFWQWSGGLPAQAPETVVAGDQLLIVQPQPISTDLNILGTIGPVRSIAVVAPFDGVISEKRSQLGDTVEVGDVLIIVDAGDITAQYRTAQSAYLKAQIAVQAMQRWESSSDVLRAKRTLEASEANLATLKRQIQETKGLLDQGIVSRNEYDGIVQQHDAQQVQVEGNRQDLDATIKRGNADNRQLLDLDLQNAADKLNELKQQLSGAKVAAGVSGVLTNPPADKSAEKVSIEPGARIGRGTPLFAIADTTSFIATGTVDEVDVNKIKVGQPAIITADAIPGESLAGKIVTVSSEATQQAGSGQSPSFEVRASFSPQTQAQRQAIRLGMSARISIETFANPSAIVVPAGALIKDASGPKVSVIRDGRVDTVPVSLGEVVPAGVEILSGLTSGEQILVNASYSAGGTFSQGSVAGAVEIAPSQ